MNKTDICIVVKLIWLEGSVHLNNSFRKLFSKNILILKIIIDFTISNFLLISLQEIMVEIIISVSNAPVVHVFM